MCEGRGEKEGAGGNNVKEILKRKKANRSWKLEQLKWHTMKFNSFMHCLYYQLIIIIPHGTASFHLFHAKNCRLCYWICVIVATSFNYLHTDWFCKSVDNIEPKLNRSDFLDFDFPQITYFQCVCVCGIPTESIHSSWRWAFLFNRFHLQFRETSGFYWLMIQSIQYHVYDDQVENELKAIETMTKPW